VAVALALWSGVLSAIEAAEEARFDEVADLLQRSLERLLGGRGSYDLYVYPPDPGDPPGFLPLVELSVRDVRIGEIPLAHVELTFAALHLDLDALAANRIRLRGGRIQRLEAVLSERDVNRVLARRHDSGRVRDLRVRMSRDTVTVTGRIAAGLISPEATVLGGFEVMDGGTKVLFIPDEVRVGGFPAGEDAAMKLLYKLNPLVDLERLGRRYNIDVRISEVEVRKGEIRVRR
jgi:hypothetical protein